MRAETADNELVSHYARDGSEAAFGALVSRHVHLVYGTALRQVGNPGLAEEVTQNVFIALARKAPRLAGHETLAGWLHRTALLESKARLRSELRRQRREDIAALLDQLRQTGRSPVEDLSPVLDEGLLELRESDRLALILRFLEERSLGEVGQLLGIGEDAARKRVDRALERLAAFFRERGFAVPSGTAATTVALTQATAASAAPAGLASTVTQAGMAACGAAGMAPLSLVVFSVMKLSTLQTAAVCSLLVAAPLVWQWSQMQRLQAQEAQSLDQWTAAQRGLEAARTDRLRLRQDLLLARAETYNATRSKESAAGGPAADTYQWNDRSPLARIPKELLRAVQVPAVTNRLGRLSPQIQAVLQMTSTEAAAVQASMDAFLARVHAAQSEVVREVPPNLDERSYAAASDLRVFEIRGVQSTIARLREELLTELNGTLGDERGGLMKGSLSSWIPMDPTSGGASDGRAFQDGDHRLFFYNASGALDGRPWLRWGAVSERGSFSSAIPIDEIPAFLQPRLQDWIDQVRADANRAKAANP